MIANTSEHIFVADNILEIIFRIIYVDIFSKLLDVDLGIAGLTSVLVFGVSRRVCCFRFLFEGIHERYLPHLALKSSMNKPTYKIN